MLSRACDGANLSGAAKGVNQMNRGDAIPSDDLLGVSHQDDGLSSLDSIPLGR